MSEEEIKRKIKDFEVGLSLIKITLERLKEDVRIKG